jgi:uracil-DNA glycosylase family 4
LRDAWVTAAVRCAPPDNKPTPVERDACASYLVRELALLTKARVLVALGGFAFDACRRSVAALGGEIPRPVPRFGHGAEMAAGRFVVLGSYHPSLQNTFTGRLTEGMLDAIFVRARALSG